MVMILTNINKFLFYIMEKKHTTNTDFGLYFVIRQFITCVLK